MAKTQFLLFLIFEAICYYLEHPDAFRIKVLYFVLEETDERILNRFESYLLMKLDRIRISPKRLRSVDNEQPAPKEILELLETEKYQKYIKAFEECIIFSKTSNPTGIYLECKKELQSNGTVIRKTVKYKDEFGNLQESDNGFDHYEPNDPHLFTIAVVDHMGLVTTERGKSLKESLDELSKNFVELRNDYNMTPIIIQQQSTENESNDSIKLGNIRPSGRGLADTKYTQRDVNLLLGLCSPAKFGIQSYFGYDITKFKDNIRFLEVCTNRDGEIGGIIALFFDGATNTFVELPPPDSPEIEKWHNYLITMRERQYAGMYYMHTVEQSKLKSLYGKLHYCIRCNWLRKINKS